VVYYMTNETWPTGLWVGADCRQHMEGEDVAARGRSEGEPQWRMPPADPIDLIAWLLTWRKPGWHAISDVLGMLPSDTRKTLFGASPEALLLSKVDKYDTFLTPAGWLCLEGFEVRLLSDEEARVRIAAQEEELRAAKAAAEAAAQARKIALAQETALERAARSVKTEAARKRAAERKAAKKVVYRAQQKAAREAHTRRELEAIGGTPNSPLTWAMWAELHGL
jgi:hypothetical protein